MLPVWSDKVVHFALYAMLATLIIPSLSSIESRVKRATVAITIVTVFAAIDEWHQEFVPGRFADVQDFYADVTGGFIGSCIGIVTFRRELRS